MQGIHPHCALMQVAAEDTHDNYVVCRGFDTRIRKFMDDIPVAKPYGNRYQGAYQIAQIFPAVLPLGLRGQNPSVAAVSQGHPADLDEKVEILYTEGEEPKVINWLLLDSGGGGGVRFELKTDLCEGSWAWAYPRDCVDGALVTITDDPDREFKVYDELDTFSGEGRIETPSVVAGNWGVAEDFGDWDEEHLEIYQISCEPGGT